MGLFDFGQFTGTEASELVALSHSLAVADSDSLPQGWVEVSPTTMGIPADYIGDNGYILIDSPIWGNTDGTIQFKVYQSDDGRLALSWAGTNNPLDVIDYLTLNTGEAGPLMDEILTLIADYATLQGISGQDVLVTGYSLGGAYTDIMAENQAELADGFFQTSTYISHDGPLTTQGIDNLFHFGYENDIVYRAAGDFDTFCDALSAAGPLLEGSDENYVSSADNVILFDAAFANPLFPFGPFSILNIAGGWFAHLTGIETDAIERIGLSAFYDLTTRDSAIVVSGLDETLSGITWVEDRATPASDDHYGKSAFLIGTNFDDMIRDGDANDFIDGMSGDDLIRLSTGYDLVSGGDGQDTVRLRGDVEDWTAYRLSDGTLALKGADGLKLIVGAETIEFEGLAIGDTSNINAVYTIENNGLEYDGGWFASLFNPDLDYSQHTEGSEGDDVLTGSAVFGMAGDDTMSGTSSNDLLVGGAGRDVLIGGVGADSLYGGEQDDVLIASGDDLLNGGHGDDVFVFSADVTGDIVIEDFNRATDQHDMLALEGIDPAELAAISTQHGDHVIITYNDATITLLDTSIDDLTTDILFV